MRLAIDGLGLVGPFGLGSEALQAAQTVAALPEQADVTELARFFSKRELRRVSHFCRLALLGATLAVEDGGLSGVSKERVGLILATGHGPVATTFDFLDSMHEFGAKLASPTAFSTSIHNVAASTISIMSGYTGPCLTVNEFAMSWASALLTAWCWLAESRVDRVLVGAVDEYHPLLAEAARQADCPLTTGEGAVFLALSAAESGRYGLITDVAMGNLAAPAAQPPLPFELPAGQAFALAVALLNGTFAQPLVAEEPDGAWSAITLGPSL
ncbi:3-oxoacyl-(acyl carrier protein) synthase II-related protein [Syntrophotalea carbinolica DSM 2380]|uniref:3-oxoacyl-(Acyl carrier protein) synthase II-related protein n=1 Tax=Syntrophotalea carbinolica (strain DSM 2380 / NBRC 103641 / GraBd1) TaxID=338963 RepID=Q3A172_SYNC1|nr:beta-ketoacyl synthase chain length factor [Syntrophotalea carbinolica]ABA89885.1 3-oxoacyl-(acyl carrier protein) synthase II-related protein [Syntrophotalea carbinolica DSM 2380]